MNVPSAGSVSALRVEGFYAYLDEIGYDKTNIFEVSTQFTRDAGLKDMADVLESHNKIDAVFSLDDETSIGILQAKTDANRTDIKAMSGGRGSMIGAFFGMLIIGVMNSLLNMLGVPTFLCDAVRGAIIIVAVLVQQKIIPIPRLRKK